MKSCSIITVAFLSAVFGDLSSSVGSAQQTAVIADDSAKTETTRAETTKAEVAYIVAEFSGSLDGRKLKAGAQVKAQVAQDVLAHGKIIIPVDASLVGHITEVKARGNAPTSRLGVIFDKVVMKHHSEKLLRGVVYALAPPTPRRSKADEPDLMMPPSYGTGSMGASPMGSRTTTPMRSIPSTVMATGSSIPVTSAEPNSPLSRSVPDLAPPMSLGVRPGVFGLKGMSLTAGASSDTPGPVILSTAMNVKLEFGTQVIVKVLDAASIRP